MADWTANQIANPTPTPPSTMSNLPHQGTSLQFRSLSHQGARHLGNLTRLRNWLQPRSSGIFLFFSGFGGADPNRLSGLADSGFAPDLFFLKKLNTPIYTFLKLALSLKELPKL
jgi:hypothetical protein